MICIYIFFFTNENGILLKHHTSEVQVHKGNTE